MEETERERGYYEFECVVCGMLSTSSTVYAGQTYGAGQHCGKPRRQVRWVPWRWLGGENTCPDR